MKHAPFPKSVHRGRAVQKSVGSVLYQYRLSNQRRSTVEENGVKVKQNTPLAIPTSLQTSGQPLSESIDKQIGRWELFKKMPKLHFLQTKTIFKARIKPSCDYTLTVKPIIFSVKF